MITPETDNYLKNVGARQHKLVYIMPYKFFNVVPEQTRLLPFNKFKYVVKQIVYIQKLSTLNFLE